MVRRLVALLAVGAAVECVAPAAPGLAGPPSRPTGLAIQIAVPQRIIGLAYDEGQRLQVVLTNTSDQPEAILDEWNSFGYFNLKLEYATQHGPPHTVSKVPIAWEKNFPTATTIQPGQCMIRNVNLDPQVWAGLPDVSGSPKVTFTAVWKQAIPQIDGQRPVWEGTVRSAPLTVRLEADGKRLRVDNQ